MNRFPAKAPVSKPILDKVTVKNEGRRASKSVPPIPVRVVSSVSGPASSPASSPAPKPTAAPGKFAGKLSSKPAGTTTAPSTPKASGSKGPAAKAAAVETAVARAKASAKPAGKSGTKPPPVAPKQGAAKGGAAKGAATILKPARAKNNREQSNVKDGGDAKSAGGGAGAASGKTAAGKSAAPAKASGAKGKAAEKAAKAAAAAPPPRRIQVMQISTLKPGAKGSKMTVARLSPVAEEKVAIDGGAKKRRSAELTKQQLDHFRELLTQRRERLASDLNMMQDEALKVTAQDNSSDSVADTGTDNYEQDFTLGLIESEEVLAREVGDALVRVDNGTFGVCEVCQTPVPLARLEILPFARFCVECQQTHESQS